MCLTPTHEIVASGRGAFRRKGGQVSQQIREESRRVRRAARLTRACDGRTKRAPFSCSELVKLRFHLDWNIEIERRRVHKHECHGGAGGISVTSCASSAPASRRGNIVSFPVDRTSVHPGDCSGRHRHSRERFPHAVAQHDTGCNRQFDIDMINKGRACCR